MEVMIRFTGETIRVSDVAARDGAGAMVEFRGIVRGEEDGRRIGGLLYEIYQPMAERMVRRIAEELNLEYPCLAFQVFHRHGLVPVGETSIYIRIESVIALRRSRCWKCS